MNIETLVMIGPYNIYRAQRTTRQEKQRWFDGLTALHFLMEMFLRPYLAEEKKKDQLVYQF